MSVKFKIGFTIAGETLFALMSKMLPIENLSVEELAPASKTPLADQTIERNQKKFLPRKKQVNKRASPGPSLTRGINAIIVTQLTDGPKTASEMQPKIKEAGFSPNSASSRLEALQNYGIVERVGDGRWRLKKAA
jgi:hypothetical protein